MVHYSCEICSYNTNLKGNYSRHLKTKKCIQNTKEKEEQKETVFICSGCNRSFRDDFNLQRHRQKKIPCAPLHMNNSHNNNNTQMNSNNTIHNNVFINAHDPNAFIKNLNKVDKAIYNNVLGSYSINSPESIERLTQIANETTYVSPRLLDPNEYPLNEEEDIENANHEYRKISNSSYLSKVFCKAFLDFNELEYTPFFRVPTTKKIKVKYDNGLCEWGADVIHSLVDSFIHQMEIVKKEKNIDVWKVDQAIHKAYDEYRFNFLKLLKKYDFENKRIVNHNM